MNFFKLGLIRAIIPFVIMTTISIFLYYDDNLIQARGTFLAGLIVSLVAGFSIFYNIESWSLLKQSAIHFACMLATIFPLLLLSGWFPIDGFMDALKIFGVFVSVGAISWTLLFLVISFIERRE